MLETFAVIERRFNIWDRDEAGMLLFTAVEANLALSGFINRKALDMIINLHKYMKHTALVQDLRQRGKTCVDERRSRMLTPGSKSQVYLLYCNRGTNYDREDKLAMTREVTQLIPQFYSR
jgi:hypothetical protein